MPKGRYFCHNTVIYDKGALVSIVVNEQDALIVVDVQNDFCPGGALPVPDGDQVVPILNKYIKKFQRANAQVYATRDWHPPDHSSFEANGGTWPPHCLQESVGAEFHPDLTLPVSVPIISKATTSSKDAYSGFEDTDLKDTLELKGIKRVFIGGLATDYCVKNTVLDALKLGFETIVLVDAIRGVNVHPTDSETALDEMLQTGTKTANLSDISGV